MTEKRREPRYPARILARLGRGPQAIELLTNNVSFRGVFIRTDSPPALRQLVRFELHLPKGEKVTGHGMVVHLASRQEGTAKGEGPVPGIGLQFWGPLDNGKAWEVFIHELRQSVKAGTARAKATDKVRRASARLRLEIEVQLDGRRVMTRDISENGMAVRTDLAMPVGAKTRLTLKARDDASDGPKLIVFDAIVRRVIDDPNFKGLGLELVDLTVDRREALVDFINAQAPSEERVFIAPGDPGLH